MGKKVEFYRKKKGVSISESRKKVSDELKLSLTTVRNYHKEFLNDEKIIADNIDKERKSNLTSGEPVSGGLPTTSKNPASGGLP